MLYIAGVCAILAAGAVCTLCARQRRAVDSHVAAVLGGPSAVEVFGVRAREDGQDVEGQVPPLVAQAQVLAAYLDPPEPPPAPPAPALPAEPKVVAKTPPPLKRPERGKVRPPVRPQRSSLNFLVRATSYYASCPDKSMALIAEVGGKDGSERWVRQGHELGHFVVHEIRPSAVVFRQGQDLREAALERRKQAT